MLKQFAEKLFANKFLLTAVSISTIIFFFILIATSRKTTPPAQTKESTQPTVSNPFSEFTNLTEEKVNNATTYRALVADRLPIYLPDYQTSVGIPTTISITLHPTEPSLTRLDITGLSYLNKDELDPKQNPNLQAFIDTFSKATSLLREAGIEPKQLLLDYGEASYVRVTARYWVDSAGLLKE